MLGTEKLRIAVPSKGRLRDDAVEILRGAVPYLKTYSDPAKHKTSIKSFKLAFDSEDEGINGDMGILIVNNMLITGFDAPVEQVMYLDQVIRAHNLLQAIARVNRVGGEGKDKGFVVDYVGIGHHLKKAIDTYDEREQKEVIDALSFPEDELRELTANHVGIMNLLKKHGLTDLTQLRGPAVNPEEKQLRAVRSPPEDPEGLIRLRASVDADKCFRENVHDEEFGQGPVVTV